MPNPFATKRPGDDLFAREVNAAGSAIARQRVLPGPGITVDETPAGSVVGLSSLGPAAVGLALVVNASHTDPTPAGDVVYTMRQVGRDAVDDGVAYNRRWNAHVESGLSVVRPAPVGSRALVFRFPDGAGSFVTLYWLEAERAARAPCAPSP